MNAYAISQRLVYVALSERASGMADRAYRAKLTKQKKKKRKDKDTDTFVAVSCRF